MPLFEFCNRLALLTEMKLIGQTLERFTNCNYRVFTFRKMRFVIPMPRMLVLVRLLAEDIPQIVCQILYLWFEEKPEEEVEEKDSHA